MNQQLASYPLYLASQSPRRQELLAQIGMAPILLLPDPNEDVEALERAQPNESARNYVVRVTRAKAYAAVRRWQRRALPPGAILCADTTVTIDDQILGKPEDAADAARILRQLSGRTHQVLTAVTVSKPLHRHADADVETAAAGHEDDLCAAHLDVTSRIDAGVDPRDAHSDIAIALSVSNVRFAPLDDVTIQRYVESGEPFGKAGAYGIQGQAASFIAHLDGSYSGVMGLPLFETAQLLRHAGLKD